MIKMYIDELLEAVEGRSTALKSTSFAGVSIDSRKIITGQLFFAIIGERFDGHQFVADALAAGAAGAVVSQPMDLPLREGQFIVQVADTTLALQKLAHFYRNKFAVKVVSITGSVGKTTTKDMIASVLQEKYQILKTEGNLNNYYGLPLTLFQLAEEHEVLVLEMGMSSLGEIELLAQIAKPQYGVVTNVGYSHIEHLKSLENVARAKGELIDNLSGEKIAILNYDDPRTRAMGDQVASPIFYGLEAGADYQIIESHDRGLAGVEGVLLAEGERISIQIPLPGEHNLYNALAAVAVGRALGLEYSEIQRGLSQFKPSKMRMNIIQLSDQITLLNDAYNANPDSMRAGLKVLATQTGRKIAVLGDMLELGDVAQRTHQELGETVAQLNIDLLFVKGDYRALVAKGARQAGLATEKIVTAATSLELAQTLKTHLQPGDTILLKGSRGMAMEEIINILRGDD